MMVKNNKNRNAILRLNELTKNKIAVRHSIREHNIILFDIFTELEFKRKNNPELECGN